MIASGKLNAPPVRRAAGLPPPPAVKPGVRAKVQFGQVASGAGHRVVLYGPGGIGKTTLATALPGPVAFFDLDDSLPRLRASLGDGLPQVIEVAGWAEMRAALQAEGWDGIRTLVLDSATRAEELCVAHTLATVKHEKGHAVTSIEGYGYGKGYQHVFDEFLPLLADLDRHCRAGRNVCLICHDCTATVPNPAGDDWLRYEPRLQSPTSGKASIRLRVREWADHVLFLGYDVAVNADGKGIGSGTRTVYPAELPHCMAKSRSAREQIALADAESFWGEIIR
ncbi:MAG: ATP-binding protein [Lentisphaerae bacterium]|nr:ATP-binding protein [Lentisphaerota bacterium]